MKLVARVAAVAWIAAAAAPLGCAGPELTLDEGRFRAAGDGILTVYVAGSSDPLFGETRPEPGGWVFEPRFPLKPGLRYHAVFVRGDRSRVERDFTLPAPPSAPVGIVTGVYPSGDRLPENLLRFYVHFSTPMSRGEVYRRVHLMESGGREVELPFIEVGEEFWDPSGTRVTLLFDPGRIKRGLKPREDSGPALEEGKSYTLVVDAGMKDAEGRPLKSAHRKAFSVGAPDEKQPDPKAWRIEAPKAGGKEPLAVLFDEPLDEGMLHRSLSVVDREGRRVAGRLEIDAGERRWRFTPEAAWAAGPYGLVVDTVLEDVAGNSIARPFEVDVFQPGERVPQAKTLRLPFEVRP